METMERPSRVEGQERRRTPTFEVIGGSAAGTGEDQFLERARTLRRFMAASIKELGLQIYFSGNLTSNTLMGMIIMATRVCDHLKIDDKEIQDLFLEAYNVDVERILKKYNFPPALAPEKK